MSALTTEGNNIHGFWFYNCPKSGGQPYAYPKYTIPKCKSKSFLDGVQKLAKNTPAPNSYKKEMSWKGKNAQIKGPKRITVIDKIMVEKKVQFLHLAFKLKMLFHNFNFLIENPSSKPLQEFGCSKA